MNQGLLMTHYTAVLCLSLSLMLGITSFAQEKPAAPIKVRLGALFSDNMMLQREQPNPIWGWDQPGTSVTVTVGDTPLTAKAGEDGKWMAMLPARKVGEAFAITIEGTTKTTLHNVIVGEVWLAGGQSNIAITLDQAKYVEGSSEAIASANFPNIRFVTITVTSRDTPQDEVKNTGWQICTPETVGKLSAVSFFFARKLHQDVGVPIGVVSSSRHGSFIDAWIPPAGYQSVPALKDIADNLDQYPGRTEKNVLRSSDPLALYNGMIHPLVPYGLRGAIWYQGESDVGQGLIYHEKLKALINGWRSVFNKPDMPFYYVQLATCHHPHGPFGLPEIWEAQRRTLSLPQTGMTVSTDVGDLTAVHPTKKLEVGERLALWALAKDYGRKDLVYSGPLYKSMKVEGDKVRVSFDSIGSGLTTLDGQPVDWFSIAGKDGEFVEATAVIENDTVVVSSDKVKEPTMVRFGWDHQAMPNLSNKERLPASPFSTEGLSAED